MNKPATSRSRGFTLIEIMLVLVVISVMAALLTVSISDNPQRQLDREARRLQASLQMVADEAVLQGREYALAQFSDKTFESHGYLFLSLDIEQLNWQTLDDKLFAFHALAPDIDLDIKLVSVNNSQFDRRIESLQSLDKPQGPDPILLLLSSGEITPFVITLSHPELENTVKLVSDGVSGVELL